MSLPKRHFHYKSHAYYHTQPTEMKKYPHGIQDYLKTLLIYYPKSFIATSLISAEIHKFSRLRSSGPTKIAHLLNLYSRIISRYKLDLLLVHQSIYPKYNPALKSHLSSKLYRASKSLGTFRSEGKIGRRHLSLQLPYSSKSPHFSDDHQRVSRTNKRLLKFEGESTRESFREMLGYLRYIRSLKSFSAIEAPYNLLQEFREALSASKNNLETVTLVNRNKESWPPAIIRFILELPKLKRFNIDSKNSSINLNEIPFNVIKKRNICYNIRLPNSAVSSQLSISTELGLKNIDFLKLHLANPADINPCCKWDVGVEDRWQNQRNSKRCLILDCLDRDKDKLNELFRCCRNITTLDIHLQPGSREAVDIFEGMQHLINLRHVFIKLKSRYGSIQILSYQTRSLFEGLSYCYQTLESISLEVCGDAGIKAYTKQVLRLFEGCSNTLRKVTLKFTLIKYKTGIDLDIFYTAISKLQQLERLNIIINDDPIEEDVFEEHADRLKELTTQCETLQELSLSAPDIEIEEVDIGLESLNKLRKLSLECYTIEESSLFHKDLLHLKHSLQILELILGNLYEKSWYKLLNSISFLKVLDILNLKINNSWVIKGDDDAVTDLRRWVSNFKTLKCAAYGEEKNPDVINVIVRDLSSYAGDYIDKFFGRGLTRVPEKRFHKLFII